MKIIKNSFRFFLIVFCFVFSSFSMVFAVNNNESRVKDFNTGQNNLDFSLESSCTNPVVGEKFSIDLNVVPTESTNIAVFRLKLSFDQNRLKYTGIYSSYGKDNFKVNLNGNNLTIIFLTDDKGIEIAKNVKDTLIEINFKVLNNSNLGTASFNSKIDGVANYDVERLSLKSNELNTSINIEAMPEVNCDLRYLFAENYTLEPKFSSKITQYYVTVPSNKDSLYVSALPEDDDAKVDINRTSLNGEGKVTDIKITVIGQDNKSRKIYKIRVNRLKKKEKDYISNRANKSRLNTGKSISGSSSSNSGGDDNLETISVVEMDFNFAFFISVVILCIPMSILIMRRKTSFS